MPVWMVMVDVRIKREIEKSGTQAACVYACQGEGHTAVNKREIKKEEM